MDPFLKLKNTIALLTFLFVNTTFQFLKLNFPLKADAKVEKKHSRKNYLEEKPCIIF